MMPTQEDKIKNRWKTDFRGKLPEASDELIEKMVDIALSLKKHALQHLKREDSPIRPLDWPSYAMIMTQMNHDVEKRAAALAAFAAMLLLELSGEG